MATVASRWVIGCMTGTSLDGLDVALAEVIGRGREVAVHFVGHHSRPMPDNLRSTLRSFADGTPHPPIDVLRAARGLGELHADAVAELCEQHLPREASLALVAAHGQTICHMPAERVSWQLFDPWPIVRKLNVPVVYDLRQADLIAGGEGAPITPIADPILYGDKVNLVFNLGGICNYTAWQGSEIHGGDVTVCNLLLDGLVQRLVPGERYDRGGRLALQGTPDDTLVALIADAIGHAPAEHATLGREQFGPAFLDALVKKIGHDPTPVDVLASAIEAIAHHTHQIVERLAPAGIVVAGGGAHNAALVQAMRRHDSHEHAWHLSDELGIPVEAREALAFAVLGALCADDVPITLPAITGSTTPGVAGTWAGRR